MTRPGFYDALTERILGSHYMKPANLDLCSRVSSFNEGSTWRTDEDLNEEYGLLHKQEPWLGQSRQNPIELSSLKLQIQQRVHDQQRISSDIGRSNPPSFGQIMSHKRKASDSELDLNLSLGLESRNEEQQGILLDDDDEHLELSLNTTTPSSSKLIKKLKEDIVGTEKARGASTLDLTL